MSHDRRALNHLARTLVEVLAEDELREQAAAHFQMFVLQQQILAFQGHTALPTWPPLLMPAQGLMLPAPPPPHLSAPASAVPTRPPQPIVEEVLSPPGALAPRAAEGGRDAVEGGRDAVEGGREDGPAGGGADASPTSPASPPFAPRPPVPIYQPVGSRASRAMARHVTPRRRSRVSPSTSVVRRDMVVNLFCYGLYRLVHV